MLLTSRDAMRLSWEMAILAACQGGAKWICVREKTASPREILDLCARAQKITEKFGAQLFLNGRADLCRAAHCDGLHLPQSEISPENARLTLGFHTPIGVSVHDLEEARRAVGEGATYLLFGHVFASRSHPHHEPRGLGELEKVASAVSVPVYAVGGISAHNAAHCLEAGARGVAAISGVWEGENGAQIAANVRALRNALQEFDAPAHGLAAILKNGAHAEQTGA